MILCIAPHTVVASDSASFLGAWRLDDGRVLTLAPSADGTWRYRHMQDGRSGRLHRNGDQWVAGPGFSDQAPVALVVAQRSEGHLEWAEAGSPAQSALRVAVSEIDLAYASGEALIAGRLVLPAAPGPHPVVILVHGSERLPAVGQWHDPYMLAAHGIGAFVYDKRGTGRSTGTFTASFDQLANDAAAAARVLARRDDVDAGRIGFAGFSQGGWVAPLAAARFDGTRAVLVAYGAVGSPLQEDRWQCRESLRRAGGEEGDQAELDALVDAAHALLLRDLRGDWSTYKAAARSATTRPWFKQLKAEHCIAAGFAAYPAWLVQKFARGRLPPDLDWNYDSTALLKDSTVPMLWLLAGEDSEAPTELTAAALANLTQSGKPFEVHTLAGAEHGMLLFHIVGGERRSTGYHPEYFQRTLAFWQQQFAID